LKWAGGKGQLLSEIESRLPQGIRTGEIDTYIEPFVGGGALFFHIAQQYDCIKHFYLFDINQDLVNCYNAIKDDVEVIIRKLQRMERQFLQLNVKERKKRYYDIRIQFNKNRDPAKLIFLNKTCYNGLYRVNSSGGFNVPFSDYKNPRICDTKNLRAVAEKLGGAIITCGDFTKSRRYIGESSFVYFDPPYHPISATSSFTSYSKDSFLAKDQCVLAEFYQEMSKTGARLLLSNSATPLIDELYSDFKKDKVWVGRSINCVGSKRIKIMEVLVRNYGFKQTD